MKCNPETPIADIKPYDKNPKKPKNAHQNHAKKAKQDEFYTQRSDIEKELVHYKPHFNGKTVLCNCDDPFESEFFRYFATNFNHLGLKKLIATSYGEGSRKPYKAIVTKLYDIIGDVAGDMFDIEKLFRQDGNVLELLNGDGDFRSKECTELLKEADIVCTNPPFSLWREYISLLMKYKKQLLIIGNQNNISYKEVFHYIRDNLIWLGYHNNDMAFRVPKYFSPRETRYWQDGTGQKWRSMGNIAWFTNFDVKKRHDNMILYKRYTPEEYPKYDNYDAIEVSKTAEIPCDYDGAMGVPITFLNRYNPDQFEILGISGDLANPLVIDGKMKSGRFYCSGNRLYDRIVIRNRYPEEPRK